MQVAFRLLACTCLLAVIALLTLAFLSDVDWQVTNLCVFVVPICQPQVNFVKYAFRCACALNLQGADGKALHTLGLQVGDATGKWRVMGQRRTRETSDQRPSRGAASYSMPQDFYSYNRAAPQVWQPAKHWLVIAAMPCLGPS